VTALPVRERRVIGMRFVGEMTQSQIADRIGVSQMHVSRMLTRSLTRLRDAMEAEDNGAGRAVLTAPTGTAPRPADMPVAA